MLVVEREGELELGAVVSFGDEGEIASHFSGEGSGEGESEAEPGAFGI